MHKTIATKRPSATMIAALVVGATLFLSATSTGLATQRYALTIGHAKRAIRAHDARDRPRADRITKCRRESQTEVGCTDTEIGVPSSWTFNGQPIVTTIISRVRVRLGVTGRLRIDAVEISFS